MPKSAWRSAMGCEGVDGVVSSLTRNCTFIAWLVVMWCLGQHDRQLLRSYMGGCQNYGPFLDPYYNTAPNI